MCYSSASSLLSFFLKRGGEEESSTKVPLEAVPEVAVAQLVESWIVIPVVVGSSPISHPKEFVRRKPPRAAFFFCAI